MEGVQEQLDREARQRPRVGMAAALASLLTIAGPFYFEQSTPTPPRAWLLDSLQRLEAGEPLGPQTSLLLPVLNHLIDNIQTDVISQLLTGAGIVLFGGVMLFLARATQARSGTLPRIAPLLPLLGGIVFAAGLVIYALGTGEHFKKLLAARTVDGIQTADAAQLLVVGQTVKLIGGLVLAVGVVLICLHAMRAGLLTRFLGVLGILVGAIIAFTTFMGAGSSPVMIFWLFALSLLIGGRWPGGDPPAWRSGTAIPWPSSAELREARAAAAGPAAARPPAAGPKPSAAPKTHAPSPATSAKKKRKRRG